MALYRPHGCAGSLDPQAPHQFAADKTTAAGNNYEFSKLILLDTINLSF